MPLFEVFGISHEARPDQLFEIRYELTKVAGKVKEMNITEDQIKVFFTLNQMERVNNPDEIIVFVHGLYPQPERTDEVIHRFCKEIGETIKSCLRKKGFHHLSDDPEEHLIEVVPYFVRSKECCFSTNTQ